MGSGSDAGDAPADFDVAIVGYGPTGATLAGLLGRSGLRVAVVERATQIHAQPRAVGFDHDAMRLFQRIGVAEALAPHIDHFRDGVYLGADGQVIRRLQRLAPPYPYAWAPNYTCDQPGLESVLRAAVATMPSVQVLEGHTLLQAHAQEGGVRLALRDAQGAERQIGAAWLVGCDGATSTVRRQMDVGLDSLDYDMPWVVVDMRVDPAHLARLPQTNVQYCEPGRPCTYVVCPGNHRRWEFMLVDGEPTEGAVEPARLWALLARWLQPGQASIWRAAAYRFHALIARDLRRGRMLLAGDSAHQTPPFLGQGMCQGLRDAGNLAWKLDLVRRGRAAPSLLDSYAAERLPHVAATTWLAKELGQLLSERDPLRARARDARLLAEGGGVAPTVVRQDLIPGLAHGFLDPRHSPLRGQGCPQPRVRDAAGAVRLLDDVCGTLRLVAAARADSVALRQAAAAHGLPLLLVEAADAPTGAAASAGVLRLAEQDGLLTGWLDAAGVQGVLVRPDHCVYGSFRDAAGAAALAAAACAQLDRPVLQAA